MFVISVTFNVPEIVTVSMPVKGVAAGATLVTAVTLKALVVSACVIIPVSDVKLM